MWALNYQNTVRSVQKRSVFSDFEAASITNTMTLWVLLCLSTLENLFPRRDALVDAGREGSSLDMHNADSGGGWVGKGHCWAIVTVLLGTFQRTKYLLKNIIAQGWMRRVIETVQGSLTLVHTASSGWDEEDSWRKAELLGRLVSWLLLINQSSFYSVCVPKGSTCHSVDHASSTEDYLWYWL